MKRQQKIMNNEKKSFASSKRIVACTMNWFLLVKINNYFKGLITHIFIS